MDRSQRPAPHLVNGLRRLVDDIRRTANPQAVGLTDVVCGSTSLLTFPNDDVYYCGHSVEVLADLHSFEEVAWLLLHGRLPGEEELADWSSLISDSAVLDSSSTEIFSILPAGARPLDLFPLCISLLSFFDPTPHDISVDASRSRVWRLLAQLPLMLTAGLNGREFRDFDDAAGTETRAARESLTWAGRLLHALRGTETLPTVTEDAAMNVVMICQCLTEMRPACFASRFAASTSAQIQASIQSAATVFVSQLRNDPFAWTSDLLRGFQNPSQAEAWWRRREGQPMPFGFSSTPGDCRVGLLAEVSQTLLGSIDRIRIAAAAARLEKLLEVENMSPTPDWAAAKVMTLLNIPADRQTLVVAMARLVGWAAHAIEQQSSGNALLPILRYGTADESETP
ncbi:MAG: citrate/2-methylcitrate synthase [Planctomycetaceae bacterium]